MKKIFIVLASVFLFIGSNAMAATIDIQVFDDSSASFASDIANWKAGVGNYDVVLENFESTTKGWYGGDGTGTDVISSSLISSGAGEFIPGGLAGTGDSSYSKLVGGNNTDPYFAVTNESIFGRENTGTWLDSADISTLTLDVTPGLTNLWFYIEDPSDQGALTTLTANDQTARQYVFGSGGREENNARFFVGISIEGDDTLSQIVWDTGGNTRDGFGIDDIGTSAVPVPAAVWLFGSGVLGLVAVRRRRS